MLTVTAVNATDIMANNAVGDSVVYESNNGLSESEFEMSESTNEEITQEDVLKTKDSNSDTTNTQQSTNAFKTSNNEDDILSESSPKTVIVNNYDELLELFSKPTSYGITEENLIINLSGDDDYKITKTLNLRNGFSANSKLKNLTINGNTKVIDGCGYYKFLELGSGDAALNLTLNDVIVKNCSNSSQGGAICIASNTKSNVTIIGSVFENNVVGPDAGSGGAIYFQGDSLKIISSNFTSNTAVQYGGAIYIGAGSKLTLIGSNLTNNNVGDFNGGAIFITGDGTIANITNNVFEKNFVKTNNHYVVTSHDNAKIIIDNNLFVNNTIDTTRDMLFGGPGTFDVKDNNIYIDNYLEDSWDSNIPSTLVMVVNKESNPIHFVNLRDIYNNSIVNGTLNFYHNKSDVNPFATFDITDGNATLKFTSDLNLGENVVWYDYTSLSKHYQNLTDKRQLKITLQSSQVTIHVNKIWINYVYGSVEVNILNKDTGKVVATLPLDKENGWENSIDLPKYDNGVLINYTVEEVTNLDYYKSYVSNSSAYNFTVTNIELNSLIVKINWDDNDNEDGLRPNSVTVTVFNSDTGEELDKFDFTEYSNWEHVFDKLPKYDLMGNPIRYLVNNTIPYYTTNVINTQDMVILNNTHIPEKIDLNVNVVWLNTGSHPDIVELQLYANGKHVGEPVSTSNNQYIFSNLPKYSNGKLIDYNVDLINLPKGCTEKITKKGYNLTITVEKSVKKIFKWGIKLIIPQPKKDQKHNKKHSSTKKISHIYKNHKQTNKYSKNKNKWNYHKNNNHPVNHYKFRLYISLYKAYMDGNMTYDDFVAILKVNHIKVTMNDWDDNGVISIDYEDINDVPDTVTLHNKKGHVPDSTVKIDKTKTKNNKVVDSKEVEVEYNEQND